MKDSRNKSATVSIPSIIFLVAWVVLGFGLLEVVNLLRQGFSLHTKTLFYVLIYYFPAGLVLGLISTAVALLIDRFANWSRLKNTKHSI